MGVKRTDRWRGEVHEGVVGWGGGKEQERLSVVNWEWPRSYIVQYIHQVKKKSIL